MFSWTGSTGLAKGHACSCFNSSRNISWHFTSPLDKYTSPAIADGVLTLRVRTGRLVEKGVAGETEGDGGDCGRGFPRFALPTLSGFGFLPRPFALLDAGVVGAETAGVDGDWGIEVDGWENSCTNIRDPRKWYNVCVVNLPLPLQYLGRLGVNLPSSMPQVQLVVETQLFFS